MAKKRMGTKPNLTKEVAALADNIGKALKAAKSSAELKDLKEETLDSLRTASTRIVEALEKAKQSDSLRDIKDQAQKVYDIGKIKTQQTVGNIGGNLAFGLRRISRELDALADRISKGS